MNLTDSFIIFTFSTAVIILLSLLILNVTQHRFQCFISVPLNKSLRQVELLYFARESKCANIPAKQMLRMKLKLEFVQDLVESRG